MSRREGMWLVSPGVGRRPLVLDGDLSPGSSFSNAFSDCKREREMGEVTEEISFDYNSPIISEYLHLFLEYFILL